MYGFPKSLPGSEQFRKDREQEVYSKKGRKESYSGEKQIEEETPLNYKQILKSIKVLVTNPTFMFLNLAAACEGKKFWPSAVSRQRQSLKYAKF